MHVVAKRPIRAEEAKLKDKLRAYKSLNEGLTTLGSFQLVASLTRS
jgi:hypothetical protein